MSKNSYLKYPNYKIMIKMDSNLGTHLDAYKGVPDKINICFKYYGSALIGFMLDYLSNLL